MERIKSSPRNVMVAKMVCELLNCLPGSPARGRAGDVVPLEPLDRLVEDGGGPVLALIHPGVEGRALVVLVVAAEPAHGGLG